MHRLRAADARGFADRDGVARRAAFSNGDFHDPDWMGFGALRVANEDILAPGAAYAPQRRANMELLTCVLDGTLRVRTGDAEVVVSAGDVHWIGAGHGIEHAAANGSLDAPVHLLQFWLQPTRVNAPVASAVLRGTPASGAWTLIAMPEATAGGVLPIRAPVRVSAARLTPGEGVQLPPGPGRAAWLQVVRGVIDAGGRTLHAGDALALTGIAGGLSLRGTAAHPADLLWFDLPA